MLQSCSWHVCLDPVKQLKRRSHGLQRIFQYRSSVYHDHSQAGRMKSAADRFIAIWLHHVLSAICRHLLAIGDTPLGSPTAKFKYF